jgi:biopolymer transport protein ExbD
MAKEKKTVRGNPSAAAEGAGFDMTPMIDVTFLLIIFFMCVTELSDASKSKLELPFAERAELDEHIPGRLVVNILKDGEVEILKQQVTPDQLDRILKDEAAASRPPGVEYPTRAILFRVDQRTEYKHVQKVMLQAMKYSLWRVAFATKDPTFPY